MCFAAAVFFHIFDLINKKRNLLSMRIYDFFMAPGGSPYGMLSYHGHGTDAGFHGHTSVVAWHRLVFAMGVTTLHAR